MSGLGSIVKVWRETEHIPQKALAERVGISPQYLCDIERGYRHPTDDDLILRLAASLDCPPDYLFHAAGRIPPDCRETAVLASTVVSAFNAMREVLAAE